MTKDKALKLALEAFGEIDWSNNSQWQSDRAKVAITAIKEALAQPDMKQEPRGKVSLPPQRTWVGLTRTELIKCGVLPFGMSYELCQAIEAKLKEKNT